MNGSSQRGTRRNKRKGDDLDHNSPGNSRRRVSLKPGNKSSAKNGRANDPNTVVKSSNKPTQTVSLSGRKQKNVSTPSELTTTTPTRSSILLKTVTRVPGKSIASQNSLKNKVLNKTFTFEEQEKFKQYLKMMNLNSKIAAPVRRQLENDDSPSNVSNAEETSGRKLRSTERKGDVNPSTSAARNKQLSQRPRRRPQCEDDNGENSDSHESQDSADDGDDKVYEDAIDKEENSNDALEMANCIAIPNVGMSDEEIEVTFNKEPPTTVNEFDTGDNEQLS